MVTKSFSIIPRVTTAASALMLFSVLAVSPRAALAADQTVIVRFEEGGGVDSTAAGRPAPNPEENSTAGHISHAIYNASPFGALDVRITSVQPSGPKLVTVRFDSVLYSGNGDLVLDTGLMNVRRFALVASLDSVPAGATLPRWARSNRQFLQGLGAGRAVLMLRWRSGDTEELEHCEVRWQTTSPGAIPQDHLNAFGAAMAIRAASAGGWLEARQDTSQIAVDSALITWNYSRNYYSPTFLRNKFGPGETDRSECLMDLVLETFTPRTFVVLSDPLHMTLKYEGVPLRLMESRAAPRSGQ
jgi:hypothetical protein